MACVAQVWVGCAVVPENPHAPTGAVDGREDVLVLPGQGDGFGEVWPTRRSGNERSPPNCSGSPVFPHGGVVIEDKGFAGRQFDRDMTELGITFVGPDRRRDGPGGSNLAQLGYRRSGQGGP